MLAYQTALRDRWMPGIRKVLSGLTENSSGTGTNASTVNHIVSTTYVRLGQLQRQDGEPSCNRNTGSFGMKRAVNGLGDEPPSCRGCLRTLEKKTGMTLEDARQTVLAVENGFWRDTVGDDRSAFFVCVEDEDGVLIPFFAPQTSSFKAR